MIDKNNTSLKLLSSSEAVCFTTSLSTDIFPNENQYRVINVKCKKGECHLQINPNEVNAYGEFEIGDKIEVFTR